MKIEEITSADYSEIESLLNLNFYKYPEGEWTKRFQHWFETNPAFSIDSVRGYCVKSSSDKIMGVIFNIPSSMMISEKLITVGNISTWYVSDEFRKKSLHLLHKLLSEPYDAFFSTTIIKEQMKSTEMFGFQKYIKGAVIYAKLIPINLINVATFKLLGKSYKTSVFKNFTTGINKLVKKSTHFYIKEGLSDRHALFWNQYSNDILTNVRDVETIKWLLDSPFRKTYYFAVYDGDIQVGMFLFKYIDEEIKALECYDYISLPKFQDEIKNNINGLVKDLINELKLDLDVIIFPTTACSSFFDQIKGLKVKRQEFNNKYFLAKDDSVASYFNEEKYHFSNQGDMNI